MQPTLPFTIQDLTSFDWFLVVIAFISAFMAFRRGFIKVLFSFAGLIFGILIASWNYAQLARIFHRWITSPVAAQVVAFFVMLFAVTLVFSLAANLVRRTVSAVGLGFFDLLLGGMFGLLRGVLLGVAIMMAISAFAPNSSWLKNSRLAPYFLAGSHAVSFVVPRDLKEQMAAGASHLLQQTPERIKADGSL
jgi:membrane protein required for colicin V production